MNANPLVEVVHRYVRGCNAGDLALLESCFVPDIRVYFLHHPPVEGRAAVALYWREFQAATQAFWTVDHVLVGDEEIVVEWTVRWTPPGAAAPTLMRGTDWFVFEHGQFAEVRQYYDVRGLVPDTQPFELQGFDYPARGYPSVQSLIGRKP